MIYVETVYTAQDVFFCYHIRPAVDASGSESPVSGTPGQNSPQEGPKRVRFHPLLYRKPPCL